MCPHLTEVFGEPNLLILFYHREIAKAMRNRIVHYSYSSILAAEKVHFKQCERVFIASTCHFLVARTGSVVAGTILDYDCTNGSLTYRYLNRPLQIICNDSEGC